MDEAFSRDYSSIIYTDTASQNNQSVSFVGGGATVLSNANAISMLTSSKEALWDSGIFCVGLHAFKLSKCHLKLTNVFCHVLTNGKRLWVQCGQNQNAGSSADWNLPFFKEQQQLQWILDFDFAQQARRAGSWRMASIMASYLSFMTWAQAFWEKRNQELFALSAPSQRNRKKMIIESLLATEILNSWTVVGQNDVGGLIWLVEQ